MAMEHKRVRQKSNNKNDIRLSLWGFFPLFLSLSFSPFSLFRIENQPARICRHIRQTKYCLMWKIRRYAEQIEKENIKNTEQ